MKSIKLLSESREAVIKVFNDYYPIVSETQYISVHGEGLKILTLKKMLQRSSITFAQVKAANTSENLLNAIKKIIYSLYRAKEVTKKLCNNIMNLIKLWNRMNNTFISSQNIKTSDLHRLLLDLLDK